MTDQTHWCTDCRQNRAVRPRTRPLAEATRHKRAFVCEPCWQRRQDLARERVHEATMKKERR
jgi:hypothetical protein